MGERKLSEQRKQSVVHTNTSTQLIIWICAYWESDSHSPHTEQNLSHPFWFQQQWVEHEALFVVVMCDKFQSRDRFSWHYFLSLKIQHLAPQRSVMLGADFCFYQGNRYCITAVTMVTLPEWTHRKIFYLWLVETNQIRNPLPMLV